MIPASYIFYLLDLRKRKFTGEVLGVVIFHDLSIDNDVAKLVALTLHFDIVIDQIIALKGRYLLELPIDPPIQLKGKDIVF